MQRCHSNTRHKVHRRKFHNRNSWRHFRKKKKKCRGLRDSEPVEGESIRSINRQFARFGVLSSFTRTKSHSPSITSVSSSSIGILRPLLHFPQRSPLPVFGLHGKTLLSRSHFKDYPYSTFHPNRPEVIVFVEQSASIEDVSIQRG